MDMIRIKDVVLVDIKSIIVNPKNRNKHPEEQIEELARHYGVHGMRTALTVSNQSGLLVAGEGRYLAAKKAGLKQVPVSFQDFDSDEMEYAYGVADNGLSMWSELDFGKINEDIGMLGPDFDIRDLGLKNFTIDVADKEGLTDEDEVPEVGESRVVLGDVWQLGDHRLMCGDSTSIDTVEKLMNGEKADMVFTDPPYNQSKSEGGFNDTRKGWADHKQDYLNDFEPSDIFPIFEICGAKSGYFFCNKGLLVKYLSWAETMNGWDLLIMGKDNPIPTKHQKYLSDIEYIVFVRKDGSFFNDELEYDFYRKVKMISVKKREFGHPTEKQVSVIEPFLLVSSDAKKSVLDLFGGSGSTLIACEKTNRKCFMMELDPHYCTVILERWEKFTGKLAVKL